MMDIALSQDSRDRVVKQLNNVLADTYTLYLKTHNYHWNVTGPMFNSLHTMFEEQYQELWAAVDEIAERIRALGAFAPGDYATYAELTSIETPDNGVPSAETMIANLARGHETLSRVARSAADAADDVDDVVTEDLMIQRMTVSEKNAWMLRSLIS